MKKLILIDSHAIIHRAFHALPPLTTPAGEPIGAVYGFTSILLRILRELKPDFIVAAFDLPGPTFRHAAYERYKATRPETPSELTSQFSKVREVLDAFGIKYFEKPGYEADDIIGTIVEKMRPEKNIETIIVTGDADAFQLVGKNTKVFSMRKGISDTVIYDEKAVRERYGFGPKTLIDYKGLRGDPSDNIPGVKGIGEKTATELLQNFGSVEGIYKALKAKNKKISVSVAAKLTAGAEDAKFSKELATISVSVPLEFLPDEARWSGGEDNPAVRELLQKFGFFSLLKRLTGKETAVKPALTKPVKAGGSQTSLLEVSENPKTFFSAKSAQDLADFLQNPGSGKTCLILYEGEIYFTREGGKKILSAGVKILKEKKVKDILGSLRGWYAFDGKAAIKFLQSIGIPVSAPDFDVMLAAYLTSQYLRDFSYISIASRELGRMVSSDPRDEFMNFFSIASSLEEKMKEGRIKSVFSDIEIPLLPVLSEMELLGIRIDGGFLTSLSAKITKDIDKLTAGIYKDAGEEFNINSSQQLSRILFDKLHLATKGLRKTEKGGVVSTRESELEKLKDKHVMIQKILDYRELAKLRSTYVDVLPGLADSDGRIHTTFNQTGAATGRLSSSDPNLQNIPIMSDYGKEVRKAFVADKGFLLAAFDYSQIELRVAAHIANDPKMIDAFKNGMDIHKLTASEIYNVPLDKVTPELRRAAKTLNFGVLYGMGPIALAEATGMDRDEARNFIDEYFRDFSGIAEYIVRTKQFAQDHGYVETIFGRRRYIPEILSPNWQVKREAERMAVNMPVQGTATGDIIKMAMIKVAGWIRKEKLESEVRMLLQVHDELLFEVKEEAVKKHAPKIKEIMESAAKLKVPLVVDVKTGKNWGETKELGVVK